MSWWTAPSGAIVVAAYDPIQGSSLADSYINRANPGVFNAAPGVAPTWAVGTGWTFNGTTQYLTTGVVPSPVQGWSMIVRYSGVGALNGKTLLGVYDSTAPAGTFLIQPQLTYVTVYAGGTSSFVNNSPTLQGPGVYAISNRTAYRDGSAESSLVGISTGNTPNLGMYIGALNLNGSAQQFAACNIQAVAIYSGALTLADVQAITAAMNALPVAAAAGLLPSMMQHAAMGWR